MTTNAIRLRQSNADDESLTLWPLKNNNIKNDVAVPHDGVEALDYPLGSGPSAGRPAHAMPQLVLLDLKLPRVDGLEVLRRLRADPRTHLLPVVVLTSSKEERDLVNSYSLGANSYVRKPVDFGEFTEAIRQLGLYWLILNEAPPAKGT